MRLLVTGASGMLGTAVTDAGGRLGHQLHAVSREQLDVTDAEAVRAAMAVHAPEAVINCAAYTDVDGAQSDPETAHLVNATAAGVLASAAAEVGARVVQVSTDYVFDGSATRPYVESDATSPRSVYGASKLDGELAVAGATPNHAIVRTAWLFGAGGSNFIDTMLRLAIDRDEVSVVTDQVGCPTWTGHLAPALLELAERRDTGIFHLAGAGSCSWNELAVEVFDCAGVACRVLPTTSERFPRPAPRPAFSVLASERADPILLPAWQDGVAGYLAQRSNGRTAVGSRSA